MFVSFTELQQNRRNGCSITECYLCFEVVLPLLGLQGFEAAIAVGGHRQTEGSVGPGGQLRGQSHRERPGVRVLVPTHDQVWAGAWNAEAQTNRLPSIVDTPSSTVSLLYLLVVLVSVYHFEACTI